MTRAEMVGDLIQDDIRWVRKELIYGRSVFTKNISGDVFKPYSELTNVEIEQEYMNRLVD